MSSSTGSDQIHGRLERSSARLAAVQALYEIDMTGVSADPVLQEFLRERWKNGNITTLNELEQLPELASPDEVLLAELIHGVAEKREILDDIISDALSSDWTIERLEVILRATLRAGTFELLSTIDVSAITIINEYVNVANAFFDDNKPGMVNGVLDKISRVLRSEEMKKSGK